MAAKQEQAGKETPFRVDVSLRGRRAWVVRETAQIRGDTYPDAVSWIIDQWIEEHGHEYFEKWKRDLANWYDQHKVVRIDRSSR